MSWLSGPGDGFLSVCDHSFLHQVSTGRGTSEWGAGWGIWSGVQLGGVQGGVYGVGCSWVGYRVRRREGGT